MHGFCVKSVLENKLEPRLEEAVKGAGEVFF